MKRTFALLIVFAAVLACSVLPGRSTATPQPTLTPAPTYTPLATYTPFPTIEVPPAPTLVEVTAPPGASFVEVFRVSGTTPQVTNPFTLAAGFVRVNWSYNGTGDFDLVIEHPDSSDTMRVVYLSGASSGSRGFHSRKGRFVLDITGWGDWSVWVEQLK